MRNVRRVTTFVLLFVVGVVPAVLSGCSGDGDGGGGGGSSDIIITITACDTTTYAAAGVFCIDFTATGPAGFFDLLAQFIGGPTGPLEGAYEIPPGLAAQLNINPPSLAQGLQIQFNGQVITGRFCWFVGADLGFIGALGVQFMLTPVVVNGLTTLGPGATCPAMAYLGGGHTEPINGTPTIPGRAGHCGENVSGKNIAIAGGYASSGPGFLSYNTTDRFTIDTANFTYSKNGSPLLMRNSRTDHACSFFLETTATTERVKVLITGGADYGAGVDSVANNTADVYCFTPQPDSISSTTGNMNVPRRGHTATWIPANKVVIIGGETGGPTGSTQLGSIEIYDPGVDSFTLLTSPVLSFPRRGHTATLLPSGKILIAGGFDIAAPTIPLPSELFDPTALSMMTVVPGTVNRVHHTATRLANGWVLLAGGNLVTSGAYSSSADVFEPELGGVGSMGAFTNTIPMMSGLSPRAYHGASLLGDGNVLLTGGETATGPLITNTAEIFLYHTLTFTPTISMALARAEHSSTPTDCGPIVLLGGRRIVGSATQFLNDLEMYPFNNMNPVVASAFTATSPMAGTLYIDMTITDEDADGGYVIIRHRPGGVGMFRLCTIVEQNPSSASPVQLAFPNMQVEGLPNQAFQYAFKWNFTADGLSSGQTVEIEILPVGVTLGNPVKIPLFQLP